MINRGWILAERFIDNYKLCLVDKRGCLRSEFRLTFTDANLLRLTRQWNAMLSVHTLSPGNSKLSIKQNLFVFPLQRPFLLVHIRSLKKIILLNTANLEAKPLEFGSAHRLSL